MNEKIISSSFWSSGTGLILKIGGFLGALTTIIAFLMQLSGFWETKQNDRFVEIIKEYYRLDSLQQCDKMALMFTPVVEDYFGKSNYNRDSITESCIKYRSKWAHYKSIPDYESMKVSKSDKNRFIVRYELLYKTKKRKTDNWKTFNLSMLLEINEENKIQFISEDKKN